MARVDEGRRDPYPEINRTMPFEAARANFVSAARQGLASHQVWLDGSEHSATSLALDVLLPLADEGLASTGVDDADRTRFLDVIERRVRSGNTGSRWILGSLGAMRNQGTPGQRLNSLAAAMVSRQRGGLPVADWPTASLDEGGQWRHNFVTIEQLMTTDLVSVAEEDPVELVANLMDWHKIRHVLVEDGEHRLTGLVSYRTILRLVARGPGADLAGITVADVMKRDPVCVPPDMPPLRALELMRSFGIGALPVVVGSPARRHRHRARLHECRRPVAARAARPGRAGTPRRRLVRRLGIRCHHHVVRVFPAYPSACRPHGVAGNTPMDQEGIEFSVSAGILTSAAE